MTSTHERLAGRVAIVTGAGRGLGRSHALYLASQGAKVVVNDPGVGLAGEHTTLDPAEAVVAEIIVAGGEAVASRHDIADWNQAGELIDLAIESFGDLHALVNNAGISRDRTLANMSEDEWDAVIRVHLKGHAAPLVHAARYWRDAAKSGKDLRPAVVNTTSVAGFIGSFGQANYSVAKLGVVALAYTAALELNKYGVRANAVSPSARTRMTLAVPDASSTMPTPAEGEFDSYDPANVSPLIGWLCGRDCPANFQVFHVFGELLLVLAIPTIAHRLSTTARWTWEDLDAALAEKLVERLPDDSWR